MRRIDEGVAILPWIERRIFVGDRGNGRILVFDQDGNELSPIVGAQQHIDRNTTATSPTAGPTQRNPGMKHGIRIGRRARRRGRGNDAAVRTGRTAAALEGMAGDGKGDVYGGEVGKNA